MSKTKKTTTLVKKKENLLWGNIMTTDHKALQVREFCIKVAKIYGVPPMGVNSLANTPYLNKEGRLYLLHQLRTGKTEVKEIKTEFLQLSTCPEISAICKKTIIFKDGSISEAIGEASYKSVKLDAVKQTLNMMAETRAMNRAIWQNISGDVMKRVESNFKKLGLTEEEKSRAVEATNVSFEEMNQAKPNSNTKKVEPTTIELFDQTKRMINGQNNQDILKKWVKQIADTKIYNEKQKVELLNLINTRFDYLSKQHD